MSILTRNQYNLGMDKYKLLSSTSGVGAIIAAKTGNYILISSINKWPFIQSAVNIIQNERETNMATLLENSTKRIKNELGLSTIDDDRFVGFLKISENLSALLLLLPIPEINLNDFFNTPEWNNHPIRLSVNNAVSNNYMIQATHFPKWFVGKNNKLQTLDKWRLDWGNLVQCNANVKTSHFAPPRDPGLLKSKNVRRKTDADGNYETMDIYNELTQTNLALICEHGHLMDIPWSKYINNFNSGNDPVNLDEIEYCCGNPSLKWTESTNKSEGFENVFVECICGKKKNLGGINSFKCLCKGHKPWEINVDGKFTENSNIHNELCSFNGNRGVMQVSLVTANRMYYATGKNSLYVPLQLKPNGFENQDLAKGLSFCEVRFNKQFLRNQKLLKEEWFDGKVDEDFLIDEAGIDENIVNQDFIIQLRSVFFNKENCTQKDLKEYDDENYRLYEYKCFTDNFEVNESGLRFNNVNLSDNLTQYFTSLKQVSELKLTQVQLSFNRNKPRVGFQDQNGNIGYSSNVKRIYEGEDDQQYVLPSVQNYGEGIFFQFNEDSLNKLVNDTRIQNIIVRNLDKHDQGYGTWEMLNRCGQKYFIIHSFSHLIMRELEFACGYPTASLKERLYISSDSKEFMAGILIYTTDGSEGSMGGLVSQASEHNIEKLIKNALLRGVDCSSDPLCWESEGQGLFDFNLAACFSCSLVAETACEVMNLGLDRRILVDEEYGYFSKMIK
ncbi:DrmB family protein [Flavobacterium sp.]|uniref:DrmB family protein n=1 Tax=Flavobacterium sp. TaxID=239 RepID=UPI003D2CB447